MPRKLTTEERSRLSRFRAELSMSGAHDRWMIEALRDPEGHIMCLKSELRRRGLGALAARYDELTKGP